jgi:hypothetical protein
MSSESARFLIFSVIGPHAGEDQEAIFNRKARDIDRTGTTFWLIRSYEAKPNIVQRLCWTARQESSNSYCYFIEPSSRMGASPTKCAYAATCYSQDSINWTSLPRGLTPVTGRIDNGAYALVFNQIDLCNSIIDLWDYANFVDPSDPIRLRQGASTICAVKEDTSTHPKRMRKNKRVVTAVAKLAEPFAVWLR